MLPGWVFAVVLCIGTTVVTAQAETPSASVAFETAEGSSSIKAIWTGCVVFFQGKAHPCSVSGLQSPQPGMTRVSGIVYDLKDLSALAGTYKAVGPDESMGPGHLRVKNDKGTTMTLWIPDTNMESLQQMQVPDSGMKLELKK
jgi:hypothetical protein